MHLLLYHDRFIYDERAAHRVFIVVLALFATFMLRSEVFIAYEATHVRIFIALLTSAFGLLQLPDTCRSPGRSHAEASEWLLAKNSFACGYNTSFP